jgi:hypothetical protein
VAAEYGHHEHLDIRLRSDPGKKIQGEYMGCYTVYSIDVCPGKKFIGITTDFKSRIISDLADAALETPRTWHGVEMKNAGVQTQQAFRIVRVARDLQEAEELQSQWIQQFIDVTAHREWYERMPCGYDPALDIGIVNETHAFAVYKCSGCTYISTTLSRTQSHMQLVPKCAGHVVLELQAHVTAPRTTSPTGTTVRSDRANIESIMATRVPSGITQMDELDTIGIDERTQYLMTSPSVLHACFDRKGYAKRHQLAGIDISLRLFIHLWGSKAPQRFQSVFTHNHVMYDLRAVGDPSDHATVDVARIKDFNEFMIRLYEVLEELALVVSEQCGDDQIASFAKEYRETLRGPDAMTTFDVFERGDKYKDFRKKDPARVKFANSFKTETRGVIKKTHLDRSL